MAINGKTSVITAEMQYYGTFISLLDIVNAPGLCRWLTRICTVPVVQVPVPVRYQYPTVRPVVRSGVFPPEIHRRLACSGISSNLMRAFQYDARIAGGKTFIRCADENLLFVVSVASLVPSRATGGTAQTLRTVLYRTVVRLPLQNALGTYACTVRTCFLNQNELCTGR